MIKPFFWALRFYPPLLAMDVEAPGSIHRGQECPLSVGRKEGGILATRAPVPHLTGCGGCKLSGTVRDIPTVPLSNSPLFIEFPRRGVRSWREVL
jgi:hypothetical protein